MNSAAKRQVGGNHYRRDEFQPILIAERTGMTPMEFSVLKYLMRHRRKDGRQDLLKCQHFLEMLIEEVYGESNQGNQPKSESTCDHVPNTT